MRRRHRILLLLVLVVLPVAAQDATRYSAPDGRFSLPIPDGWTAEQLGDTAVLTAPDSATVMWLALEAEDADSGGEAALEQLVPDFVGMPVGRDEFPGATGVWIQQVYVNFTSGEIVVTLTLHARGTAYVALIGPTDEQTLDAITPALISMLVGFTHSSGIDIGGVEPAALDEQMLDELDAYIADAVERYNVPGASVGIVQNGEIIFVNGYGVADRETETPVTTDTRFMIGSVTKSMTSLLFAQLVDEGLFAWDTPVTEVFPAFALADAEHTAQITMRNLLSMSTGLPRYDLPLFLQTMTPAELIADLASYPLVAGNGEEFHYNNQIYAAGGFIAAVLTGAALDEAGAGYAALLETRLFGPAGMTDTTLDFDEALASGQAATPYYFDLTESDYLPVPYDYEHFVLPVSPAGAVWSDIDDMIRYLLLLQMSEGALPDGTAIVSTDNLAVTHTGVVEIGDGSQYALGWMVSDIFGQPLMQHDGGTAGFTTTVAFLPEAEIGVVVLTNRASSTLGNAIRDYTVELAFGLEHEADAPHEAGSAIFEAFADSLRQQANLTIGPADAEAVATFLGEYERGVTVSLADDGTLMFSVSLGEAPLYPAGEPGSNTFITGSVLGDIEAHFAETGSGIFVTLVSLADSFSAETPPLILHKID